jgi:hypothetical protein
VQQQQAGLSGNGHPNLVVDLQPAAAFERFLIEKNKDVSLQLQPIVGSEFKIDG